MTIDSNGYKNQYHQKILSQAGGITFAIVQRTGRAPIRLFQIGQNSAKYYVHTTVLELGNESLKVSCKSFAKRIH